MNERVTAVTGQIKQAFEKVKEAWQNMAPLRKRIILIALIGLLVLAVGLTIVLRTVNGRYVVLYEEMTQEEAVTALGVLEEAGTDAQLNAQGQLEVPSNLQNQAMGQLAMKGIPQSTLGYGVFEQAGGLTTTDFEKRQYQINQLQNRMQDIIRTYDGVANAYVTLNMDQQSNRVWDAQNTQSSASVKVDLQPGAVLTTGQVSGIRFLVGPSVGIAPEDVAVIDSSGQVLAAVGDNTSEYSAGSQFLERMGFEQEVEQRMVDKTANILSMQYPDPNDYRISATAQLDYDAMITESVEYSPLEGTDHGVAEHEEYQALMGTGQYAEGVVGETDNTDIPVYADLDGDGEMDAVDYYMSRDYLVSYVKQQVEKDGAKLSEASIAVVVRGTLTNESRQNLRELISTGTNIPVDNVTIQGMLDATQEEEITQTDTILGIPLLYIYIALIVLVVLIILLIVILILRRKSKLKKLAAEEAAAEAELAEQERIALEIEERKKQLKDAALSDQQESAITDEVREFARTNPEITANLLRNWLKEGE